MIPVTLRRATSRDADFLFELRNDAVVRQNSFSTSEVTREEHEAWLRHVLADVNRQLLIAQNAETGAAVGQIRLDYEGEPGYEISYSVAPAYRGQRIGTIMIAVLMERLSAADGRIRVFARVKPENAASSRIFEHNGFIKVRHTDEFLEYERYVHEA